MASSLKVIRRFRHWKQRFDPAARFVWRRSVMWGGKRRESGTLVPASLATNNEGKLRRLWDSEWIELAEFEVPNVATGQTEPPTAPEGQASEDGSGSVEPSEGQGQMPASEENDTANQLGPINEDE